MKELSEFTFEELADEQAQEIHSALLLHGGMGLRSATHAAMEIALRWSIERKAAKDAKLCRPPTKK